MLFAARLVSSSISARASSSPGHPYLRTSRRTSSHASPASLTGGLVYSAYFFRIWAMLGGKSSWAESSMRAISQVL